jgi:phosphotransferase system enzyme I (PtsI)
VLDMISAACAGASKVGKPIGVCGESAGDPGLALVLVGLGVTSLSMAVGKIAAVRTALAKHTLVQCQELAALALTQQTWQSARDTVLTTANQALLELY